MTISDRIKAWLNPPEAVRGSKAVVDLGPWASGIPLSAYGGDPQQRAAAYLRAFKVGWFYKAGNKISGDLATLPVVVSEGDTDAGTTEATLDEPDLDIPFEALSPIEQFQRLMEKPNPKQTGRALRQKTQIRLDFAGAAFWYLENARGGGLPSAIYGISPTRMWPSYNNRNQLIGWVMDKDSPSGGMPFDVDEILPFSTATPDDVDWMGVSVVESVYSQVPITDLIARHTADVLTTGGRLAGMLWPRERSLTEDEFTDAQRAWRNVSSDPNAARRLLIFPEPMEWSQGAASPTEIGIPELASLTRDEILTAFPISPYMLGVPTPGGLNSGEVRREERKDYWTNAIEPRADLFEEVVKTNLLSRYEQAMGRTFNVELEIPHMDDATTLTEKAEAFKVLVSIGFDPEETVKAVALDHIKWNGTPPEPEPQVEEEAAQEEAAPPPPPPRPMRSFKTRDDTAEQGQRLLADFFEDQRKRTIDAIRASYPSAKAARKDWAAKADPAWWNTRKENQALAEVLRYIYRNASRSSLQVVADTLDRIVPNKAVDRVTTDLLKYGGQRIADINDRTLQAISVELAEGTRRGYTTAQLIDGVPDENFKGVLQVGLDNGTPAWSELRAETIARTETALSYNRASLRGYQEFNVREVEAIDGDEDEECAERNGQTFAVEDALEIDDHPNGTLDWVPVTDKAYHDEAEMRPPDIHIHIPDSLKIEAPKVEFNPTIEVIPTPIAVNVPAQPAPVVNVTPKAPVVNVTAEPILVDMGGTKAQGVQDVRIVESTLPPRKRKITRDSMGRVTGFKDE